MLFALSTPVYGLLGALYLVMLIFLGLACIRNGHWIMFIIGIAIPIFWIIGALMPPTSARVQAEPPPPPPPPSQ